MRRLAQIRMTAVFAEIDEYGHIGETRQSPEVVLTGAQWHGWAIPPELDVLIEQLGEATDRQAQQQPAPPVPNRAARRATQRSNGNGNGGKRGAGSKAKAAG